MESCLGNRPITAVSPNARRFLPKWKFLEKKADRWKGFKILSYEYRENLWRVRLEVKIWMGGKEKKKKEKKYKVGKFSCSKIIRTRERSFGSRWVDTPAARDNGKLNLT